MINPLIDAIVTLLKDNLQGISEFDILKTLKNQFPEISTLAKDSNVQLFRQHFLIMNALYQLQGSLWQDENLVLSIHALEIKLQPSDLLEHTKAKQLAHSPDSKLAAYYLDWDEYDKTDSTEVSRLLDSFYRRMNLCDNKRGALSILQINTLNPSKIEIKKKYRKLVKEHHPDFGGEPETFIELRQAYEQLIK